MEKLEALRALYESTRAIGLVADFDELIGEILAQAQQLLGFEHCGLLLLDAAREELHVHSAHGFAADAARGMRLRLDQGLSGYVATHRVAVRVDDVGRDPRYLPGLEGARSALVVPLVVRNQLVGVVNVESRQGAAFTEEHERLLTVLGAQAALAIEASQARASLEREVQRLQALYRLSQLASTGQDSDVILASMLEIAQDLIPEGYCAVLLLDPSTRSLRVRASRGYVHGTEQTEIPLGRGITGRCAAAGQPVLVGDVQQDPDYLQGVPGARSELAVPMMAEGRVVGVINAESPAPDAYREEHVQTLSVVANQAAVVLRAAWLQEETRRLAATDPLTGLANRRQFLAVLERHLRHARRYPEPLAVAFLDLDDFKRLNDLHGHQRGDRALQAVADAMREWARETDTVARLGGDEFAALLLRADVEGAWQALERLRRTVEDLAVPTPSGERVGLRLSAGVAVHPRDGLDAETLLLRADAALYAAKRAGKNQVVLALEGS